MKWNVRDNQPHGYSRPILFPHSAKCVRDCRQNHHDCRQNLPWLLWNALLTTPYVSEHYKYSFWLLETCTKFSYFIEENIRPSTQQLAFEVKYEYIVRRPRIYCGPAFCAWTNFQTSGDWSVKTQFAMVWKAMIPAYLKKPDNHIWYLSEH